MTGSYQRHLSFPFHIDSNGRAAQVSSLDEHVRDELIQLILTNPGERLFLPEFGSGIRRLVFENADVKTEGLTRSILTQAISRWIGHRVKLENLVITVKKELVDVELKYRVAGTETSKIIKFQRSRV